MPIKAKLTDNTIKYEWGVMEVEIEIDIEINQDGSEVRIKTEDGFVFYLQDDGKVVDNLNPELVDMIWLSFRLFLLSQL
tara:strand:+ start:41 stop:277 length:237 start_codon:yes stop_codon:yes gene_type:complete